MSVHRSRTRRMLDGVALGAVLIALASLTGFTSHSPAASAAGQVEAPPSPSPTAAMAEVRDYLRAHPRPAPPGENATPSAWADFYEADGAFLHGFPLEAGVAQWGCRLQGRGVIDHADARGGWYVIDCGEAERPSFTQITSLRTAGAGATRAVECEALRGGEHCFEFFPPNPWAIITYRWLGSASIYGSHSAGYSSLPAPGCDAGDQIGRWPVQLLEPGWEQELYLQRAGVNWSSVFSDGTESGEIVGVRSMACRPGPAGLR